MAGQGYSAAHKSAFNAAIRSATVDDAYALWQELQAAGITPPRQVVIQLLGLASAGALAGLSKLTTASATVPASAASTASTPSAGDKDTAAPGKACAGAIAATAPSKPHGVALPPSAAFAAAMRGPAGGPTHTRPTASCSLSGATLAAWATDMMQRAAEPRAADKPAPPAMPEAAWTTYIRVLACAQQVDTARSAAQAMLDQGVAPKLRTFAGLLEHAAERGDVALLAEIWAHLYNAQLQPGATEFAHALRACVQAASGGAAAPATPEHTRDNLFALGQLLLHRALPTVLHAPDALQSAATQFFQAAPALAATPAPVSLQHPAWRVHSQVVGLPTDKAPSADSEALLSTIRTRAPEPWQVCTVRIPADGQVPGQPCLRVRGIDLAAPDVAALAAQVRHLAVSGISKRYPQGDHANAGRRAAQMQAFDKMLDKVEPFDVIIDAANVAHFATAGQMSLHQLHACVCDLILRGRRVLVVLHDSWLREPGKAGPGHKRARVEDSEPSAWSTLPASVYDWAPEHFGHAWSHGWQAGAGGTVLESHGSGLAPAASAQSCMLWRVHRGNNDDWYWLYAALRQQRDRPDHPVHVLSNDQMRDHHFAMLAPAALLQWRARHQVTYDVRAPAHTGATGWTWFWHWPPAVSHRAQADPSGRAWFFPISSDLELLHAAVSQQGGQREVANPAAAPPPSDQALESEWLVAYERPA